MRPAGGLQKNQTFFLLDGDDSPLLRRFQKNSLTAKTRQEKGDLAHRTKAERKNLKIYSRTERQFACGVDYY
jgi:hypothetical protein